MVGVLTSMLAYLALVALLLGAPRVRKRWLRITSRVLGVAGLVPIIIALPVVLFAFALTLGEPPPQTRIVKSPEGQEAKLIYNAGFLGRDHTEVTLKRTDCCQHTIVMWHSGPSELNDPKLEWLDDRHFRLTYHARPTDGHHCESRLADITIDCISLPWPESTPITGASPQMPDAGVRVRVPGSRS